LLLVARKNQNEEIFVRFMNDEAFRGIVSAWMSDQAYRHLRAAAPVPDRDAWS
jgi:hypothetical protein